MVSSYYNLFVGTENGLIKGINTQCRTFNNLNSLENLNKEKEALVMCWNDDSKQEKIYFVTRDQHIVSYDLDHLKQASFYDYGKFDLGVGLVKAMENVNENKILTANENGLIKLLNLKQDEPQFSFEVLAERNVGANLCCTKINQFNRNLIATGGRENDLKVWNLEAMQTKAEPIFKAKNLPDNWMQLKEPIWVMCVDFLDENKIAVGTGHHQIRIYDVKSNQRRPVINYEFNNSPITCLRVLPNNSNKIIAANTRGEMEMIDIRFSGSVSKENKCFVIKKYKGFQGTIKSIEIGKPNSQSEKLQIASCGLDRYLRLHDVESGQMKLKLYLKSRMNCLLFSHNEPLKANLNKTAEKQTVDDDQLSNINSEDLATDDLWSDMETIIETHPNVLDEKSKLKLNKRIEEFASENDEDEEQREEEENIQKENDLDSQFKKPKPVLKNKKIKKIKSN